MTWLLAAQWIVYALSLWVGLYLLANDVGRRRLNHAGGALLLIAAAVATSALLGATGRINMPAALVTLSASLWTGGMVALLPEEAPSRTRLLRVWQFVLLPLAALVGIFSALSAYMAVAQWMLMVLVVLPLILLTAAAVRDRPAPLPKRLRWLLAWVAAMYVLSLSGVYLVQNAQLARWFLVATAFDLSLLGLVAAGIDAHEQGERFRRDFVRELDAAVIAALLFGLPVILTMLLSTGATPAMIALSLVVIGLAIAGQTLNEAIQGLLDRVAFSTATALRQERAALRETAANLPRADERSLLTLDEDEFAAVTRRALSQLGNLPKLAASPLAQLAIIDQRLATAQLDDNTLTRAAELKRLLIEAIDALRPDETDGFDPAEAWRFYNALYYPYVLGIRPYRRRPVSAALDAETQAALDWLRAEVPERTLYNWQKAGALLVATHLRELTITEIA